MFEVYAFATPNSVRVPIALEEMGLDYALKSISVRKGEQKAESFLALNANGKVPVLVDPHGPSGERFVLTESAAILVYLAEKKQKLLPMAGEARARVFEQLFFHVSGIGPAYGQAGFFLKQAAEQIPLAISRFTTEAARVTKVLDGYLARSEYTAGGEFTIADIVHCGWMWRREFANIDLAEYPHVKRWYEVIVARPAVKKAIERVSALIPPS
jgi:GST-like protein